MNEPIQEGKPIYVFQLPIRIWHWTCCRTSAGTYFSTGPRASTSGTIRWPSSA